MADDARFVAVAELAVAIVDLFGCLPDKRRAESVGILTFYLLDWLDAQQSVEG